MDCAIFISPLPHGWFLVAYLFHTRRPSLLGQQNLVIVGANWRDGASKLELFVKDSRDYGPSLCSVARKLTGCLFFCSVAFSG